MRLLADENVPQPLVRALRSVGYDVIWVREVLLSESDRNILAYAQSCDRIVLTNDKDFGALIYQEGLVGSAGVILLRDVEELAVSDPPLIVSLLRAELPWRGHFAVVMRNGIRFSPLPAR